VKPCADIVRRFLSDDTTLASKNSSDSIGETRVASRELWTQYVCEVIVFNVLARRLHLVVLMIKQITVT
jgi:K+-transporting ATPase A subunit